MCGIVGYTGSNLDTVKRAHALQTHRGPDDEGFYSDDHISLGHNRLAIIDINTRSAQPMWDTTKRYCIVFNGEIYNYQELRSEHLADYRFQTESDTEVILALFEKFGKNITSYLRGMYAFVIYDRIEKELHLFRDEFGIKPLFYAVGEFGLCFASELKSIVSMLRDFNHPLTLSEQGLAEYRILGYTIAPSTLYNEIKILKHGHNINYKITTNKTIIDTNIPSIDNNKSATILQKTILENTIADVPVGIFFSGGIDSSLIAGLLTNTGKQLKTFTLNVSGRNSDTVFSEKIANHLNITPDKFEFSTGEFDESYADLINFIDHPAGSTSMFQTHYLAKQAVKKVKVVLMGDGGDELFYGYPRSLILQKMKPQFVTEGAWVEKIFFLLPHFKAKNYLFGNVYRLFKYSVSYYILTMCLARNAISYTDWQKTKKVLCDSKTAPENLDREFYLTNDLLYKGDFATAFCALEGRVPLASESLMITLAREARKSFELGIPKYHLKSVLKNFLPEELVERKKSGFGIDYKSIAHNSVYLKKDFEWAVEYLEKLMNMKNKSFLFYEKYNPQYIIALVVLAKTLSNNDKIYTAVTK